MPVPAIFSQLDMAVITAKIIFAMPVPSDKSQEQKLVIFKIGEEEFGLEISQVREIVRLIPTTPIPRAPYFIEGVVNLRGQILAVVDLSKRIDIQGKERSDKTRIIVAEIEGNPVGIIVDEVTEVLRLSKSQIDETPGIIADDAQSKYIKGVGKLEDRLIIMIDLTKIFSAEEIEDMKKSRIAEEKPGQGNAGKESV